jgi:two-component system NtrC family sensor kinase
MVREMLDFGKELEIHSAHVSLNAIVEEAIEVAKPMAQESGVELCVETDSNLVEFPMDGPRIKQVLLNLISNSIQACTLGNKVTIKTESSNGYVLLQVSDQGCGISPEDRDKIFDPFFSKKTDGTGLGLAIVKKIVEAHDANISVQSNEPQGTTITIAFAL